MALTAKQAQNLLDTYEDALEALQTFVERRSGVFHTLYGTTGAIASPEAHCELRKQIIPLLINALEAIANNSAFENTLKDQDFVPALNADALKNATTALEYIEALTQQKHEHSKRTFLEETILHFYPISQKRLFITSEDAPTVFSLALDKAQAASTAEIAEAANLLTKIGKGHAVRAKARREAEENQKQKDPKENGTQETSESSSNATFYLNCLASIAAIGGAVVCVVALVTGQPLAIAAVGFALAAIGFMAYRPSYGNEQKEEVTPKLA